MFIDHIVSVQKVIVLYFMSELPNSMTHARDSGSKTKVNSSQPSTPVDIEMLEQPLADTLLSPVLTLKIFPEL
jgi:hypothetical protein